MKNIDINLKKIFVRLCAVTLLLAFICVQTVSCSPSKKEGGEGETAQVSTPEGDEICNLLLVGRDESAGLADAIILVSFNLTRSSATLLQIPRDTYAEYTSKSYKKINGALSELGAKGLCEFLSGTLCVPISYYAVIGLDALGEVVDTLGGVEVDVPFDLDYEDRAQGLYIHIKKGKHTLDGKGAQHFVRYRSGYSEGDIGRIDAQKIFLSALIRGVKQKMTALTLASLAIKMLDDVNTNLPITKIASLAKAAISLEDQRIRFVTLPGAPAVANKSGASYYVISKSSAARLMSEYLGGFADGEGIDRDGKFMNESYEEFCDIYRSDLPYALYDVSSIENGAVIIEGS